MVTGPCSAVYALAIPRKDGVVLTLDCAFRMNRPLGDR
jgi:hypothetical protein